MSKEIVIDCKNDGTVEGMHFDQFDLGFLGDKAVERASEIFHNPATQLWDILLPGQSEPVRAAIGFTGYDIARKFEVEWLQQCRKEGTAPESVEGQLTAGLIRVFNEDVYGPHNMPRTFPDE